MTSAMLYLVLSILACDSEAPADAGFDARVADAGRDAGARDAGRDAGFDAGLDAGGPDAGSPDRSCTTHADCEEGTACRRPICVPITEYDCCLGGDCPGGDFCNFEACRCPGAGGCCDDASICARTEVCSESCTCEPAPDCMPECEMHEVCMRGRCLPRCFFDGCPTPGDVCGDDGCAPAACTVDECLLLMPPARCDVASGCYDECTPDVISGCGMMGASCMLGVCIDESCAPSGRTCGYRTDCCSNVHCLPDDAPDPPCPPTCSLDPVPPRMDLCQCGLGGGCVDLFRAGMPPPPPPPPVP
jgi:hypothetical protein